jgi:hypothetical protein
MIYKNVPIGSIIGSVFGRDSSITPALAPVYASKTGGPSAGCWDPQAGKYKVFVGQNKPLVGNPRKPLKVTIYQMFSNIKRATSRKRGKVSGRKMKYQV